MATAVTTAQEVTMWEIDPVHTSIEFAVKHMMVSNVRGQFTGVHGTLRYSEKDLNAVSVTARIDPATINTREPDRDTHLKSADFFDVEHYPEITFASNSIKRAGHQHLKVFGTLTIHGKTNPVVLIAEKLSEAARDPWGKLRRGTTATVHVNRKDYGLVWNKALETGGFLVGDDVTITVDAEFVEKDADEMEVRGA